MNERLPEDVAVDFLKHETFYLLVIIFVTAFGALGTFRSFSSGESLALGQPIYQEGLQKWFEETLTAKRSEDAGALLFPAAVRTLGPTLLVLGIVSLAVMCGILLVRGHLIAPRDTRLPPWGLWDVLKAGGMFAAGAIVFGMILKADSPSGFKTPNPWVAEMFSRVLLIGVLIHILISERGARPADIGITASGIRQGIILGLIGFLCVQPCVYLMTHLQFEAARRGMLLPAPLAQDSVQGMLTTKSPVTLTFATIAVLVFAPVSEEMLFRGFLLPALRRWLPRSFAVVISAAFFAAAHMDLYVLAPMLVLGLVLGYLYDRTQSLVAPVTMHVLFNGFAVLTLFAHRAVMAASAH